VKRHSSSNKDSRPARLAVEERLISIKAAAMDLDQPEFRFVNRLELDTNRLLQLRYQNRLLLLTLQLSHLRDDVFRLASRMGVAKGQVARIVDSSTPLRVLSRLANAAKHGLGGRDHNATLLNGFVTVQRTPRGAPAPDDRVHLLGMLIVDAKDGTFPSATLCSAAIWEWSRILEDLFGLDRAWANDLVPNQSTSVITLTGERHAVVPQGGTLEIELPRRVTESLVVDANIRESSA
jgi:hypothetical protein